MRKLFVLALFLATSPLWAADVYVAQSSAGGNTGADCANARALSSLAAGDWSAGNTIHLCGTIAATAGTSGLVAQGSGTSGSPIIVKFETGAILQATYFGYNNGCSSLGTCLGGIEAYNQNYIIIDGGTNGIIQNTANGTNLANQQASSGITLKGSNYIVRNLTIRNIYANDPTTGTDFGGLYTYDVVQVSGSNLTVCNNTLKNAHTGIGSDTTGGAAPSYPLPSCASNTFTSGTNLYSNTLNDHVWQFNPNGSSTPIVNIWGNDISGVANWTYTPNISSYYHTDGVIAYGDTGAQLVVYYFNNINHDTAFGTAAFYCTYGQTNSGCAAYIFNNVFEVDNAEANTSDAAWLNGDAGYPLGPHYLFNNTFVNNGIMVQPAGDNLTVSIKNNLVTEGTTSNNYFYSKGYGTNALPSILTASDYNNFYGGRGLSFNDPTGYYCWPQSGGSPSGCSGTPWVNTGFDTHSVSADPKLNANYTLQATSPDRNAGTNLTSLCSTIAPLCYDAAGNARPATGAWDIGAYQYQTGIPTALGWMF